MKNNHHNGKVSPVIAGGVESLSLKLSDNKNLHESGKRFSCNKHPDYTPS